jgi:hypothetical protein
VPKENPQPQKDQLKDLLLSENLENLPLLSEIPDDLLTPEEAFPNDWKEFSNFEKKKLRQCKLMAMNTEGFLESQPLARDFIKLWKVFQRIRDLIVNIKDIDDDQKERFAQLLFDSIYDPQRLIEIELRNEKGGIHIEKLIQILELDINEVDPIGLDGKHYYQMRMLKSFDLNELVAGYFDDQESYANPLECFNKKLIFEIEEFIENAKQRDFDEDKIDLDRIVKLIYSRLLIKKLVASLPESFDNLINKTDLIAVESNPESSIL